MVVHQDHPILLVSDIAHALNIPESYLAKVFRNLAKTGLIRSFRGAKGGYSLGRSPEKITLKDLVKAVEGDTPIYQCLAARRGCDGQDICEVIATFDVAEDHLYDELGKVNFKQLKEFTLRNPDRMAITLNNPRCKREAK
jgi:Rrf2 family protein